MICLSKDHDFIKILGFCLYTVVFTASGVYTKKTVITIVFVSFDKSRNGRSIAIKCDKESRQKSVLLSR